MGLDATLLKEIYVGGQFNHRNIQGILDLKPYGIDYVLDFKKLYAFQEYICSWRKAYSVHTWIINNCTDFGDGAEAEIPLEELKRLQGICEKLLKTKDGELEGITYEDAEYIYQSLSRTIAELHKCPAGSDYIKYRATW